MLVVFVVSSFFHSASQKTKYESFAELKEHTSIEAFVYPSNTKRIEDNTLFAYVELDNAIQLGCGSRQVGSVRLAARSQ